MKIAGRDAGRKAVVVEELDNTFVIVDGNVRRKKVNVKHLEPLEQTVDIPSGASHEEVAAVFKKQGFSVWETTSKTAAEKPRQKRKGLEKAGKAEISQEKKEKKKAKKTNTKN